MGNSEIIEILRDFKKQYSSKYGIISMGVFGSVARNEANEDSDVDIYVQTLTPNPFYIVHIKEDIEQQIHRKVDIVRIHETMNPHLKQRIERDGIYV